MEIKNTPLEVFPLKSRKQAVLERRKAWDAQTAGGQLMTLTQVCSARGSHLQETTASGKTLQDCSENTAKTPHTEIALSYITRCQHENQLL